MDDSSRYYELISGRSLNYWTLAFFAVSSVARFGKSRFAPERILKFARLQLITLTNSITTAFIFMYNRAVAKRTNEQWITALEKPGPKRETALIDLQQILVTGLQRGLLGQINTSAPEFESLAEDFVQEALLKIIDKLHTFAGRSQFTTWAHKVAVSVALTELRRKRWQDKSLDGLVETESGDYTPSFMADPYPTPDNATEQAEMLAKVEQLINDALTPKQREALVASTIEGKSASEVAIIMDMKPNAVYKLLHDARLRLKRTLAEEGMSPADVLAVFE